MVAAVFEIEYAVETEEEARALAERDASRLFQQDDVLAVSVGPRETPELPITERYLEGE